MELSEGVTTYGWQGRGKLMKVFISWSGERSRAVAEALQGWLPDVMQAIEPWVSFEDTRKGQQWNLELMRGLEGTHVGVICLTPENQRKPWLLFEAGALSMLQTEKGAYVCTYLVDMSYGIDTGPLALFQHTLASEKDTYRLTKTINAAIAEGQGRLSDAQLDKAFECCWPKLKQCLDALPEYDRQGHIIEELNADFQAHMARTRARKASTSACQKSKPETP